MNAAIHTDMWRFSGFLWSAMEWCDDWTARRRLRYCCERQQSRRRSSSLSRSQLDAIVRTVVVFLVVILAAQAR